MVAEYKKEAAIAAVSGGLAVTNIVLGGPIQISVLSGTVTGFFGRYAVRGWKEERKTQKRRREYTSELVF